MQYDYFRVIVFNLCKQESTVVTVVKGRNGKTCRFVFSYFLVVASVDNGYRLSNYRECPGLLEKVA